MSYAKLFSSITESSLWSEPKEVRLLFVTMLAKANSIGFVEASVPGLARVANLSPEEVETAIPILEGPDPFSKNPDCDGRRIVKAPGGWMVINYEDYRNRASSEERREYMREYMRNYRKENGCKQPVNNVKQSKKNPSASASLQKGDAKGGEKLPAVLDTSAFRAAWDEWQSHRREIKKPLTTTSIKAQLSQFETWGEQRSIRAIQFTIRKGWQGLTEDESRNGSNTKPKEDEPIPPGYTRDKYGKLSKDVGSPVWRK